MSSNIMNIFNGAQQSLVQAHYSHLFVANELGLVKVIDMTRATDEPEVLETVENLTGFAVHQHSIAAVSHDGELEVCQANETYSDIVRSLKCYRSELPLRDVKFLNQEHVLVCGETDELVLVSIKTFVREKDTAAGRVPDAVTKFKVPDQARSLSFCQRTSTVSVALCSGTVHLYKFEPQAPAPEQQLRLVKDLGAIQPAYFFVPEDGSVTSLDNIARNNAAFNESTGAVALTGTVPESISVYEAENGQVDISRPAATLTGYHSKPIVEIQYCNYNAQYVASIDFENRVVVWDTAKQKPVFNRKLAAEEAVKLRNITWLGYRGGNGGSSNVEKVAVSVGTTSGDIYVFDSIVEPSSGQNGGQQASDQRKESEAERQKLTRLDFEEEDDDFNFSDDDDDNLINATTASKSNGISYHVSDLKRAREQFESDSDAQLSDGNGDGESDYEEDLKFINNDSVLPRYTLKPYAVGVSPWLNNKRYLTINEIGSVFCERNVENNTQTITVKFQNGNKLNKDNTDYYFIDSVGYDLAYLNGEGLLLASSAFIDKKSSSASADIFGTSLNSIKEYKQARVLYRPHRAESDSWDKLLPIKNYYQQSSSSNANKNKGKTNEFITNVNLAKRFIFIFTNYGHMRILTKFGLLLRIEKSLPTVASISSSKILFTINVSLDGRTFYYNIRDLITNNRQNYIERNQLLPLDYVPKRLLDTNDTNFDHLLQKFETFEKKTAIDQEMDLNLNKGPRYLIDNLVYAPPCYAIKGLFINNFGDPCLIDNNHTLYVLTKWKRPSQASMVPLLNMNEILLTRSHLNYVPLSLVNDKFSAVFFNAVQRDSKGRPAASSRFAVDSFLYPQRLPEPTEINIKIPVTIALDMKALKEQQKARKAAGEDDFIDKDDEDDDFIEKEDNEDGEDDNLLSADSEDEELNRELQKELESEEAFLRAKILSDLIAESLDSHSHFEKAITSKFRKFKRTKRALEAAGDDAADYFLNELDLNLSDNEIERDDGDSELRLKNSRYSVNDCIDKLQELNSAYDKSLLKMFSAFCANQEYAKAGNLVRELKQDRALIAASRIAERLEINEVVAKVNEEREKRMEFD